MDLTTDESNRLLSAAKETSGVTDPRLRAILRISMKVRLEKGGSSYCSNTTKKDFVILVTAIQTYSVKSSFPKNRYTAQSHAQGGIAHSRYTENCFGHDYQFVFTRLQTLSHRGCLFFIPPCTRRVDATLLAFASWLGNGFRGVPLW